MFIETKHGEIKISKTYATVAEALQNGYTELFSINNGLYSVYSKSVSTFAGAFKYALVKNK